ncbi:MAG: hypothetical protein ACR2PX_26100 [Endozoicomonas sp.]
MFSHLMSLPVKDLLTPEEKVEAAKDLEERKAWYKKYQPALVK